MKYIKYCCEKCSDLVEFDCCGCSYPLKADFQDDKEVIHFKYCPYCGKEAIQGYRELE